MLAALKAEDFKTVAALALDQIESNPKAYKPRVLLGLALDNQGDEAGSEAAYRGAIEVDAAELAAWRGLVKLFERSGGAAAAEKTIEPLGRIAALLRASDHPKWRPAHRRHAAALEAAGRFDEALTPLATILGLATANPSVLRGAAALAARAERGAPAKKTQQLLGLWTAVARLIDALGTAGWTTAATAAHDAVIALTSHEEELEPAIEGAIAAQLRALAVGEEGEGGRAALAQWCATLLAREDLSAAAAASVRSTVLALVVDEDEDAAAALLDATSTSVATCRAALAEACSLSLLTWSVRATESGALFDPEAAALVANGSDADVAALRDALAAAGAPDAQLLHGRAWLAAALLALRGAPLTLGSGLVLAVEASTSANSSTEEERGTRAEACATRGLTCTRNRGPRMGGGSQLELMSNLTLVLGESLLQQRALPRAREAFGDVLVGEDARATPTTAPRRVAALRGSVRVDVATVEDTLRDAENAGRAADCGAAVMGGCWQQAMRSVAMLLRIVPSDVWANAQRGWLLFLATPCQLDAAIPLLRAAVTATPAPALSYPYYRLACAECKALGRVRAAATASSCAAADAVWESAHGHLMQAAKRDASHAASFAMLGLLYEERGQPSDATVAVRCLTRAVTLDAATLGGRAGTALCALLDEQGAAGFITSREVQAAAVASSASCWWGWAGLALAEVKLATGEMALPQLEGSAPRAAEMLQKALRIAPARAELWCALGEVYLLMGRIVASVKALSRAEDLLIGGTPVEHPTALARAANGTACSSAHLLERLGAACAMAGENDAAVLRYKAALDVAAESEEHHRRHPAAAYGLATTLLALARRSVTEMRYSVAAAQLRESSAFAHDCIAALPCEIAPRKLLGDVHITAASLSDAPFAPASASLANGADEFPFIVAAGVAAQRQFVGEARRAFAHAVHLDPTCASLWRDLGAAQVQLDQLAARGARAVDHPRIFANVTEELASASSPLRAAAAIEPLNPLHWKVLALGERHPLAKQHALVRALQLEQSVLGAAGGAADESVVVGDGGGGGNDEASANAWSNLGLLYLWAGELSLSRRTYVTSQCLSPCSPDIWMGHALLNTRQADGGAAASSSSASSIGGRGGGAASHAAAAFACAAESAGVRGGPTPPLSALIGAAQHSLDAAYEARHAAHFTNWAIQSNARTAEQALLAFTQRERRNPDAWRMLGEALEMQRRERAATVAYGRAGALALDAERGILSQGKASSPLDSISTMIALLGEARCSLTSVEAHAAADAAVTLRRALCSAEAAARILQALNESGGASSAALATLQDAIEETRARAESALAFATTSVADAVQPLRARVELATAMNFHTAGGLKGAVATLFRIGQLQWCGEGSLDDVRATVAQAIRMCATQSALPCARPVFGLLAAAASLHGDVATAQAALAQMASIESTEHDQAATSPDAATLAGSDSWLLKAWALAAVRSLRVQYITYAGPTTHTFLPQHYLTSPNPQFIQLFRIQNTMQRLPFSLSEAHHDLAISLPRPLYFYCGCALQWHTDPPQIWIQLHSSTSSRRMTMRSRRLGGTEVIQVLRRRRMTKELLLQKLREKKRSLSSYR